MGSVFCLSPVYAGKPVVPADGVQACKVLLTALNAEIPESITHVLNFIFGNF